jgi:hypothetical protein
MTNQSSITISDPQNLLDVDLAVRITNKLTEHYPGHAWAVNVDSKGGVVNVKNYLIHSLWGFRLLLKDVYADPDLKCVMRAGGEFLEHFRLKRGPFSVSQYQNAPKDPRGEMRPSI